MTPERSRDLFMMQPGHVSDRSRWTVDHPGQGFHFSAASWLPHHTRSMLVPLDSEKLLLTGKHSLQSPPGHLVSKNSAVDEEQRQILLCLDPQWFSELLGEFLKAYVFADHLETLICYILNN